jgi:hypothetical protein
VKGQTHPIAETRRRNAMRFDHRVVHDNFLRARTSALQASAHHRHIALLNHTEHPRRKRVLPRKGPTDSKLYSKSSRSAANGDPQPLDIRTGNPSTHLAAGRGLLAKVIERRIPGIGLRSENGDFQISTPVQNSSLDRSWDHNSRLKSKELFPER